MRPAYYVYPGLPQKEREDIIYEFGEFNGLTIPIVLRIVAEVFNVRIEQILSSTRKHEVVRARFATMAICRSLLGYTYARIGGSLDRDHATVMYGIRTSNNWIKYGYGDYHKLFKLAYGKCSLNILYDDDDKLEFTWD